MEYKSVYKVEKGKLLKLKFESENRILRKIEIRGDFFLYPENKLKDVEKFLIGLSIDEIDQKLNKFLLDNKIIFIGFEPLDLEKAIKNGLAINN